MFNIDVRNSRPIYEQLADNIEKLAIKGILEPDSQLPSVRQLAMELSINPNTIQRAYTLLESKGIIYSTKGKGSFINNDCSNAFKLKTEHIKKEIKKLLKDAREIGIEEKEIQSWFAI